MKHDHLKNLVKTQCVDRNFWINQLIIIFFKNSILWSLNFVVSLYILHVLNILDSVYL